MLNEIVAEKSVEAKATGNSMDKAMKTMVRMDKEVRDFLRLIKKYDLRAQAVESLTNALAKKSSH